VGAMKRIYTRKNAQASLCEVCADDVNNPNCRDKCRKGGQSDEKEGKKDK
jgi:hypothetical protein